MTAIAEDLRLKDLNSSNFAALVKDWQEPAWLTELRLQAFGEYASLAWPDSRDPKWKRSKLEQLRWDELVLHANPRRSGGGISEEVTRLVGKPSGNGSDSARYICDLAEGFQFDGGSLLSKQQVSWIPLAEAIRTKSERVRQAWTSAVAQAKGNKFLSLALAVGHTGYCLFVPKNTVLKSPLLSYVVGRSDGQARFPLQFIFVEESSEIQFWEELRSPEGTGGCPGLVTSFSFIDLGANAKAELYYLQQWGPGINHLQFQSIHQGAQSRLRAIAVAVGGLNFRNEILIELAGRGAENKILGLLFGERNQNVENWITQNHVAPRTTSDIQYRGALKGSSRSFFSGMVSISKEAQQSDAYQSVKCLLLSPNAHADAIPNLEILADDVKCSHGAAVGQVDEDQRFYLQTRGIAPDLAEEIIVQGFFEPVIAEVPSEAIQERLRSFVEEKLHRP